VSLAPLMAIHIARACSCRQGVEIEGARYAIRSTPHLTGRAPGVIVDAARLAIPSDAQVYCSRCGETGAFTHTAVKRDGEFVSAMAAEGPLMETRTVFATDGTNGNGGSHK